MALKKSDIARPALPMEAVEVPELGGEVIVRGLRLSERLDLAVDSEEGYRRITRMLSIVVVDTDQVPIFSQDEWEVFGAKNAEAVMRLWVVSKRLSGLDVESAEKN